MQVQATGKTRPGRYRGWPAVVLQSEECVVTITPDLGGKIASFVSRRTGREYFVQPMANPAALPQDGVAFVDSDPFGFDDMFPTILAGDGKLDNGRTVELPDHGEVWARQWQHERGDDWVELSVDCRSVPARFAKRCSMPDARTLRIDYEVTNLSDVGYDALWAAHPLINSSDAVEVDLPAGDVISVYDGSQHYGDHGTRSRWQALALPATRPAQPYQAHKFYAAEPDQVREMALRFTATGERIVFRQVSSAPAYFGMWHEERPDGLRVLAPEPCTGGFDRPDLARRCHQPCHFAPNEVKRWRVELEIS